MNQANRELQAVVHAPDVTIERLQLRKSSAAGVFFNDKNGDAVSAQSPEFWASLRVSFFF